jgi:Protein of unknown function (DUF4230)
MPALLKLQGKVALWGALLVVPLLLVVAVALQRASSGALRSFAASGPPQISHEIVMEWLSEVAKLVASEVTLRDVVIYEQTRYRSTKRALLVVTGRVSAGINLRGAQVEMDSVARRITVTIPPAQILSIDVTNVTTYDESAGLLNPFTPDDRDEIMRRIRPQLMEAARESGILAHADRGAAKALADFLKLDGYSVEIRRPLELKQPTG